MPTVDQGGSVPLVFVAAFGCPPLPLPRPAASRDRRGGKTCELNVTTK